MRRLSNRQKLQRIHQSFGFLRAELQILAPLLCKPTELGLQRIFSKAGSIGELEGLGKLIQEVEHLWGRIEDSNGCFYKLKDYIAAEEDSRDVRGKK